jgi:hypothetical protein
MKEKMKKIVAIIVFSIVVLTSILAFSFSEKNPPKLETTTAAVVALSLQLGEKAVELFSIKDKLVKIVQVKISNVTLQERLIMDTVSELKYTATVAYFEGNLLGAVLAIKEEYRLDFVNGRIIEFEQAIRSTESSLLPIQVAYSEIESTEALHQIDKAKTILLSLADLYRNSIEILEKIRERDSKIRKNAPRQ